MLLDINGTNIETNDYGEFSVTLLDLGTYSIQSGLPRNGGVSAIYFDELVGTGQQLADQSPITIAMQRHISLGGPVCRQVYNGIEYAYFPYINTASVPLQIPLATGPLNSLESFSGQASPPELFVSGAGGFTQPLSHFVQAGTYGGRWRIAGQELAISGPPQLCSSAGDPGDCSQVDRALYQRVLTFTRNVVQRQVQTANSLAGRTWRPNSANRLVIFNRGARSLANIRAVLDRYNGSFVCQAPLISSCRTVKVNKQAIRAWFYKLYVGTPAGLSPILRVEKSQKAELERLLRALPDEVVTCD